MKVRVGNSLVGVAAEHGGQIREANLSSCLSSLAELTDVAAALSWR